MEQEYAESEYPKDRGKFAEAVVMMASNPRSKRGGLDYVNIFGSAEALPNCGERKYRFIATFIRTFNGSDNQYQKPCSYDIIGDYEGNFQESEIVQDNLALIRNEIEAIAPHAKIKIKGKVLAVESAFKTLETACSS